MGRKNEQEPEAHSRGSYGEQSPPSDQLAQLFTSTVVVLLVRPLFPAFVLLCRSYYHLHIHMTLLLQSLLLLRVLYRPYYHYAAYYHDEHCSYYLSLRVLGVDSWLLELLNGRLSVHGRSIDDSPMVALYWLHGPSNGRLMLLSCYNDCSNPS